VYVGSTVAFRVAIAPLVFLLGSVSVTLHRVDGQFIT
jgi:hypothetical protein